MTNMRSHRGSGTQVIGLLILAGLCQLGLLDLSATSAFSPTPLAWLEPRGGHVGGAWEEPPCARDLFILQIVLESLVCARPCSRS